MAIAIAGILGVLSIAVLVFPFLKYRSRGPATDPVPLSASSGPELDAIYDALRTLQLEHQLGNVPETTYREQLEGYRLQAAVLLRQQSEDEEQSGRQELEQEILAARAAINGSDNLAGACPECSATLLAPVQRCPQCHAELTPRGLETGGESNE